jgi:lipid II:glycine glycyltransferase (peptidoglycan interpeptide bridge formation enzyme)
LTRKQHRIPPQPYHFFEKVYDRIVSKGMGFVVLASYNGVNIAGAVFFHFGGIAIYKYGASDKNYRDLRANNLVMWEGIKWLMNQGCKTLSFGRTEIENTGLRQFKTGWGPGETCIHYYRYDIQKGIFLENQEGIPVFRGMIFAKMPIPFLRLIAGIAYRHMG